MGHRIEKRLSAGRIPDLSQLLQQIEIVPAHDAFLDESLAGFCHLLIFFLSLQKLARIARRDGAREAFHVFNPVQLLFDGLAPHRIADELEDKQ